ncbi:hypothetical protein [Streptomyces cellulosae]|uniref:Uncharacterized protein n=1 Tax=Streptomyces cellulosae TaxID=1968 RepID=A0ABW7XZF3_STRCE
MNSTRRIAAAVGLALGVTGLAVPLVQAAETTAPDAGELSPVTRFDPLGANDIPVGHRSDVLRISQHWPR